MGSGSKQYNENSGDQYESIFRIVFRLEKSRKKDFLTRFCGASCLSQTTLHKNAKKNFFSLRLSRVDPFYSI